MSLALYGNTCPRLAMATGQIGRWHRFMLLHENFNGQTPAASDISNGKRSNSPRRRTPWPPINYDREARAIFAFRFLLQHVLLLSPIVFLFRVAKLDRLIRCGIPRHCFQTAADPYQHLPPRVCWWAHHTTTCINVAILRVTTFSLSIPFFYSFWTSFSWTSADTFFFSSLHRTCSDAFSLYLRVYNGLHDDQPLPTSLASSNTELEAGEANKTRTTPTGPYEEKGLPPQPTARTLPQHNIIDGYFYGLDREYVCQPLPAGTAEETSSTHRKHESRRQQDKEWVPFLWSFYPNEKSQKCLRQKTEWSTNFNDHKGYKYTHTWVLRVRFIHSWEFSASCFFNPVFVVNLINTGQ